MWFPYFVEAWGMIIITYTKLLTDANPYIMGLTYFACIYMAKNYTKTYFSPATAIVTLGLGHITLTEFFYYITAQMVGAGLVLVTFLPLQHALKMD